MPKAVAAGLVMVSARRLLLVHPGGPYFKRRNEGVWSIPKGLVDVGEDLLAAARREFEEETGFRPPQGGFVQLGFAKQSKKVVHAWAFEGEWDPSSLKSNHFELEWPPRSGRMQSFPEADRAAFFPLDVARQRVVKGQIPLLERALQKLGA